MRVLITGAAGFVGRALAAEIAGRLAKGDRLTLCDIGPLSDPPVSRGQVEAVSGDLGDQNFVSALAERGFDCIYHLATVPGRASEVDFVAGKRANLDGAVHLLEAIRTLSPGVRLVYASSAAVYGGPVPSHVDDDTLINPTLSYAAHKAACEILINDYSRHGFVDGLALRLSGILARPGISPGNASAFLNDMIHAARAKRPVALPMGPDKRSWLMSVRQCVVNLLHAGALPADRLPSRRNWALPALDVSMAEMIAALARRYGSDVPGLFTFAPDQKVEAMFSQPPMHATMAERLGFRADESVDALLDGCGLE